MGRGSGFLGEEPLLYYGLEILAWSSIFLSFFNPNLLDQFFAAHPLVRDVAYLMFFRFRS